MVEQLLVRVASLCQSSAHECSTSSFEIGCCGMSLNVTRADDQVSVVVVEASLRGGCSSFFRLTIPGCLSNSHMQILSHPLKIDPLNPTRPSHNLLHKSLIAMAGQRSHIINYKRPLLCQARDSNRVVFLFRFRLRNLLLFHRSLFFLW